jgi:hypothetical protein
VTLRQDIVSTAGRAASVYGWVVSSQSLDEWLAFSRAVESVARDHGLTRDQLQDQVDAMSWPRLVAAVLRASMAS